MTKLLSTLRIAATLTLARTFGDYQHSGWNGEYEYSTYRWRGRLWVIPTSPVDEEPTLRV